MTGKNFMKLIISIWCIALIKAKSARKSPPQYSFIHNKDNLSYLRSEEKFQISPLDGAQYSNILLYLKQATKRNNERHDNKKNIRQTPIVRWWRIQTNCIRTIIIFIFTFTEQNKHTQVPRLHAIRAAKRTGNALRQLFESYHPYLMKALNLPRQT